MYLLPIHLYNEYVFIRLNRKYKYETNPTRTSN